MCAVGFGVYALSTQHPQPHWKGIVLTLILHEITVFILDIMYEKYDL